MHGRREVTKFGLTRMAKRPTLPPQGSEKRDRTDTRRRVPMKVTTHIKAGTAPEDEPQPKPGGTDIF